jgi:ribosome-associated protein
MRELPIRGDTIRLGQLMKLAGIADGGGHVKALLAEQVVLLNGEPEQRRGRQLHPGDGVAVGAERLRSWAAARWLIPRRALRFSRSGCGCCGRR